MTLEQLRVFVAVAERQHVTRAAEALNLAQSAVSSAIAGLEARHEVKLFNRVGRGIELTQAGTLFLAEARAVLARAESAELVLSELGGLERGTLVVQASQIIVVVGPEHPWIGRESLMPSELADTEWVLREHGSGTRSAFEQALIGFGI